MSGLPQLSLVLASSSAARRKILTEAGINPLVKIPVVDEASIIASLPTGSPGEIVNTLATAKASLVAKQIKAEQNNFSGLVLGCDSMFYFKEKLLGKPHTAQEATRRWQEFSGNQGDLVTGHSLIYLENDKLIQQETASATATVIFQNATNKEITAYVGTTEPLYVAGGFTLEGYGSWLIQSIVGHPSTVMGLSIPTLESLLNKIKIPFYSLWK